MIDIRQFISPVISLNSALKKAAVIREYFLNKYYIGLAVVRIGLNNLESLISYTLRFYTKVIKLNSD